MPSALQNPEYVDKTLAQELAANRIAGPFTSSPFHSFCVSPLGLIPKKIPGDFWLIHHLSFPKGISINDGIASENMHIQYAGPGCYHDIKSTFRIIPIHKIAKCVETIEGFLKGKKSDAEGAAIIDWATKFRDECDNTRDRFSQALL